jgi:hypothetical protein
VEGRRVSCTCELQVTSSSPLEIGMLEHVPGKVGSETLPDVNSDAYIKQGATGEQGQVVSNVRSHSRMLAWRHWLCVD